MTQEKTIADLAYHLWHARGCPNGSSEIDWVEAERQVRGRVATHNYRAAETPPPAREPIAAAPAEKPPVLADADVKRAKKKTKR